MQPGNQIHLRQLPDSACRGHQCQPTWAHVPLGTAVESGAVPGTSSQKSRSALPRRHCARAPAGPAGREPSASGRQRELDMRSEKQPEKSPQRSGRRPLHCQKCCSTLRRRGAMMAAEHGTPGGALPSASWARRTLPSASLQSRPLGIAAHECDSAIGIIKTDRRMLLNTVVSTNLIKSKLR